MSKVNEMRIIHSKVVLMNKILKAYFSTVDQGQGSIDECFFFLLLPNPVVFLPQLYEIRPLGEYVPVADCQFSTDCDNSFPGSGFCRYPVIESGQGRFALRDGRHHFLKCLRRMAFYPVGA